MDQKSGIISTGRAKPGYQRNMLDHTRMKIMPFFHGHGRETSCGVVEPTLKPWDIAQPPQITPSYRHSMASKARKLKSVQDKVFNAVEDNSKLLDLLEIATSTARKTIFINALLEILPTAFGRFDKKPDELFSVFTSWFGDYDQSNPLFTGIYAALQHRQHYIWDNRFLKRKFITDIGLDWTANVKSEFFSKVNSLCNVVGEGLISFLDQDDLCPKVENPLPSQIQLDCRIRSHR